MSIYFDGVASTWDLNPMKIQRAKATAEKVRATPIMSRRCLIDFGGGTGLLSMCLKDDFDKIIIVDSSEAMRGEAERKISDYQIPNISTASNLSEATTCSAIASLMALHHVQDLADFFSNASRKIESSGALLIADLYEEDGSFHHNDPYFKGHNGFNIDSLSTMMLTHGFKVSQVEEYFNIPKAGPNGLNKEYPIFFLTAYKI
jgi:cyclopropane fatty-acyl-phospholipid synthase-like methyltransferase